MLDLPETDMVSQFEQCFQIINDAKQNGGSVLVHCKAGVSRSASVVIGYLIHHHGMSYQEAYDHVKCRRAAIKPNDGFIRQLKEYASTHTTKQL